MRIAIIGTGAIGSYVAHAVAARPEWQLVGHVTRSAREGTVARLADLPPVDVVVDCAGHSGLARHGADALSGGIDVLSLSLGALADDALAARLAQAATEGGGTLHLCSGAIGALDALRAAREGGLIRVGYIGRKPPAGWRGSPAEDALDLDALTVATPHFTGNARDAALRYPKNANVAAAVALSGIGFDATEVKLIADPDAVGNTHEITAEGNFGSLAFQVTGAGLPDNPRSSALAAMSALAGLDQMQAPIRFI